MKTKKLISCLSGLLSGILAMVLPPGCTNPSIANLARELDSISAFHIPDRREGISDVMLNITGGEYILKGETDKQALKDDLVTFLSGRGIAFTDSVTVLPDRSVAGRPWGIVNVSVCNMRAEPSHTSEMVSQAVMGTPVRILKIRRSWYLAQTPDRYLGWIDAEAVSLKSIEEADRWRESSRAIYMKKTGDIFGDCSGTSIISDIVSGSIVEVTGREENMTKVLLPDGRSGYLRENETVPFNIMQEYRDLSPEKLVSLAVSFMGIPYLWGGTSVKGFDCSGFVKTIYYLEGIILARDASLQFRHGIALSSSAYPDSLITGDLLFFGTSRDGIPRPTHVGMYLGDTEFIHASGMVKINSLDSTRQNFSRSRRESFLGVRRINGAVPGEGIQLISKHEWYLNN